MEKKSFSELEKMARSEKTSSEELNIIVREQMEGTIFAGNWEIIMAVLNNEKFKMEKETIKIMQKSSYSSYRSEAAKRETSSKRLNKMLRHEVNGYACSAVIETIMENEFFEIDENSLKHLLNSYGINREHVIMAAAHSKTPLKALEKRYIIAKEKNDEFICELIEKNISRRVMKFNTSATEENVIKLFRCVMQKQSSIDCIIEILNIV